MLVVSSDFLITKETVLRYLVLASVTDVKAIVLLHKKLQRGDKWILKVMWTWRMQVF